MFLLELIIVLKVTAKLRGDALEEIETVGGDDFADFEPGENMILRIWCADDI